MPSAVGGASPPPALNTRASIKKQQQQQKAEINLIDDFGPSVSVSAQTLLFDPLAGVRCLAAYSASRRRANNGIFAWFSPR